jgi:hypothetical protein
VYEHGASGAVNGGKTYPAFTGIININGDGEDDFTVVSGGYSVAGALIFGSCANAGALATETTYYAGGLATEGWNTTYQNIRAIRAIRMPRAGVIRGVAYTMRNGTPLASGETSTLALRVEGVDHEVDLGVVNNAIETGANSNGLWIPVSAGDLVTFKWETPNWATPPLASYFNYTIDFSPAD